jgi:hypothetical protein
MTIILVLLSSLTIFSTSASAEATELKIGDVLLQPLHCYACNLIEAQTKSEYSHIGVVVAFENDEFMVAEAFGKVRVVSFEEFNKKTQKKLKLEILRPHYVSDELYKNYLINFDGLPYDSAFLWDDKAIYCSELVQKLFAISGMVTPMARAMSFNINRPLWDRYFRGQTPEGLLGISPEDFKQSKLFQELGFYGHQ